MRLEIAEELSGCKLWVSPSELEELKTVASTGAPLILPDDVVEHLKAHKHHSMAEFPGEKRWEPFALMIFVDRSCWFKTRDECWDAQGDRADPDYWCSVHGQARD